MLQMQINTAVYTRHTKFMPFQIDQLPSSNFFTDKNFTNHLSGFIFFLSQE